MVSTEIRVINVEFLHMRPLEFRSCLLTKKHAPGICPSTRDRKIFSETNAEFLYVRLEIKACFSLPKLGQKWSRVRDA